MTKMLFEKLTCFWRSVLLVVEPHSRSTEPFCTSVMRLAEVTGISLMSSLASFKSALMASTAFSIISCE
jgi:hypothetical protein